MYNKLVLEVKRTNGINVTKYFRHTVKLCVIIIFINTSHHYPENQNQHHQKHDEEIHESFIHLHCCHHLHNDYICHPHNDEDISEPFNPTNWFHSWYLHNQILISVATRGRIPDIVWLTLEKCLTEGNTAIIVRSFYG